MFNLTEAIESLENQNFIKAKALFTTAIREGASQPSLAYAGLAICSFRENSLTIAKRELEQALKLEQSNYLIDIASGLLADREGRSEEAERYFFQATKSEPKSSYSYLVLGSFFLHHESYEEAIWSLKQAKELGGNPWVANRNLAIAYSRTGQRYEAFKASVLFFVSKPSRESFELVYGSFFRAYWSFLRIIFALGLFSFFFFPRTIQGTVIPTLTLIAIEFAKYVTEKNRRSLLVILLYFVVGTTYYFVFVK